MAKRMFTPVGRIFNLGVFALVLEAVSAVALLATSSYLISRAAEQPPIMYLMMAVVGVRAFALGRASFRYLQRLGLHDAVFAKLASLRPKVFIKLSKQTETEAADSLEKVTTDLDSVQDWTLRVLGPLIQSTVAVLVASILIATWYPVSGLATLIISVGMLSIMLVISYRSTAKSSQERSVVAAELRATLIELFSASELIVSYGLLPKYRERINRLEKRLGRADLRFGFTLGFAASLLGLGAILAVVISAGLSSFTLGQVPGHMLALAVLTPFAIFDVASNLQSAAVAFHRFALARQKLAPLLVESESGSTPGVAIGVVDSIAASHLTIRRGDFLLAETSFSLPVDGISVLQGQSGSGKSSIALALTGLLPYRGNLKVNGIELSGIDPIALRKLVVLIEQHPHVFLGSVRDNLAISGQTDQQLMLQVLSRVGLDAEFLDRGLLDLKLSEGGANISGGQAQRLAIARALLSGAKYLILDEPTSGLDWVNAMKLRDVILELGQSGVGFLVITHDAEFASTLGDYRSLDLFAKQR